MKDTKAQARRRLDQRLESIRLVAAESRPHRGWIRAIRDALDMSTTDLAARMGISQQAITDLERSEQNDRIMLETLRRAAVALDCDLVYALVPRTSLEDAVSRQAEKKAKELLDSLAHHSRLEDQEVTPADTEAQIRDLANSLVGRHGLWADSPKAP